MYACFPPILSRLAENNGVSLSQISVAFSMRSFAYCSTNLFLGKVFDRFQGNKIIGISLLYLAIFTLVYPHITNYYLFVVTIALCGIMPALVETGCNAQINWLFKERSGTPSSIIYATYSIGSIVAPILVGISLRCFDNFIGIVSLIGLIVLPIAVNMFFLKSVERTSIEIGDVLIPRAQPDNRKIIKLIILFSILFLFFAVGNEQSFNLWIPSVVFKAGISTESQAALMTTCIWIGSLASRLLTAILIRKIQPQKILFFNISFVTVCYAVMFLARSPLQFMFLAELIGFGNGPTVSTLIFYIGKKITLTGERIGQILGFMGIGAIIIPPISGLCFEYGGIHLYAIILVSFSVFSFLFITRLIRI